MLIFAQSPLGHLTTALFTLFAWAKLVLLERSLLVARLVPAHSVGLLDVRVDY